MIYILSFFSLIHADAIGTYEDALAKCNSSLKFLTGEHNSSDAYIITEDYSTVKSITINSSIDYGDYSYVKYIFKIGNGSESYEDVTKSINIFNTTYNAEFYITTNITESTTYSHLLRVNESSNNTEPIFKVAESNNGFIETITFEYIRFRISQLNHPLIYSEYGTNETVGIRLKNISISTIYGTYTDYFIYGASMTIQDSIISIPYYKNTIYATKFLSINDLYVYFPYSTSMIFDYDPERYVINFNASSNEDSYLSLSNIMIEPEVGVTNARYCPLDYVMNIDLRKVTNCSNMCAINYRYRDCPIRDINKYGLHNTSYSLYNFYGNSSNLNRSTTNAEYIRQYVNQMVRPYVRPYELNELNTSMTDKVDELNTSITDKVDELNNSMTDKVDELNTSISNITIKIDESINSLAEDVDVAITEVFNQVNEQHEKLETEIGNISEQLSKLNQSLISYIGNLYERLLNLTGETDLTIDEMIDMLSNTKQTETKSNKSNSYMYIIIIVILSLLVIALCACNTFMCLKRRKHVDDYISVN